MLLLPMLMFSVMVNAQGTTTASMNGKVTDQNGETLPGATVVALHVPSGMVFGTTTRNDGAFNLPNIPIGGPYKLTISFVGYKEFVQEDINLRLGENLDFDVKLTEESMQIGEVVVVGVSDNTFNSSRTGAKTNVTNDQIQKLPSISRSFVDYARLTPQATVTGSGISFSGTNNRYNSFQIDGTVNNDVFGLSSSGTNGGQAGTQPISLDAIQELQIVIAPYDVRQGGFTGGGINVVTKSGTNQFTGTAFMYTNNQNYVGKTPTDDPEVERKKLDDYTDRQIGFSLGGPIIKNKLFFFVNGELTQKQIPLTNNVGEGSNLTEATLQQIVTRMSVIAPTYDHGGYGKFTRDIPSAKLLVRLDWNINDKHRLTLRNSFVDASQDVISRTPYYLQFNNNGYTFFSTTNSTVLELNSRLSNKFSNELRMGYTRIRDYRDIMGEPFPFIAIQSLDGVNATVDLGSERYSVANKLNQDIFSISDNFSMYWGNHVFTFGTHNEFFKFYNLFIRDNYGAYTYRNLDDFLNGANPRDYSYSFSVVPGNKRWAPEFSAYQLGFYAQDEWAINKRIKLTLGLRVDVPVFPDKPTANTAFNSDAYFNGFGVATDQMPSADPLWSPRFGFNWDVMGDRSTQVRGGAGIFTGRLPFVWLSNQFSNTGVEYIRYYMTSGFTPGFFSADPYNQPVGTVASSSEIDVVDPNFKFPQVFRVNLAIDQKLPYGIKGTLEGIYSKTLNNILYQDLQRGATGTLPGIDNRPTYAVTYPTTPLPYTNVIYLTNTNEGYTYSISASLQKDFAFGLNVFAAYTYGMSEANNDGTSSQAISNWRYIEQYNGPNDPELSFSDFDIRHRIIGSISYKKEYAKMFATSLGLFYNGQSGSPFTYIYNGDINRDGQYSNDVIFVPTDAQIDDMVANGQFDNLTSGSTTYTPAEQASALKTFIADEPYLKNRRGEYAERNGARPPFEHLIDLRLTQDFYLMVAGKKNTLQVTFDILNVANLLNKDWGRVYSAGFNYQLIRYTGVNSTTGLPRFTFNPTTKDAWYISDFSSRWRAQLGIRYIFN